MLLRLKTKIKALEGRYGKNIPARRAFNRALKRNSRAESVALARDLASFFQTRLRAGIDHGTVTFANGDRYVGDLFAPFLPHGEGTMTYKDGNVVEGTWETGELTSP